MDKNLGGVLIFVVILNYGMELIAKYFPNLTPEKRYKFEQLESLYIQWNSQINVISRKDMDHFYEHHVLHSLGLAKVIDFLQGATILDVGTGGGFPGIPLAIMFPDTEFLLVDSIGKKIKVVNEVSQALSLFNVKAIQCRAEEVKQKFDFVISRAVTRLPDFMYWVSGKIKNDNKHTLKNGVLYLKGGDLVLELAALKRNHHVYALSDFFAEPFFETKKVVHIV